MTEIPAAPTLADLFDWLETQDDYSLEDLLVDIETVMAAQEASAL